MGKDFVPDLAKCPVPTPLPANVLQLELFQLYRDQYIVAGLGTVVGIDKNVMFNVMKMYEGIIDDPIVMFEKLCILAHLEVLNIQEKSEKQTSTKPEPEDKQNQWNQSRADKNEKSPKRRKKG